MNPSDRLAHVEQTARYKLSGSTRVLVSRELRRLARVLAPGERLLTLAQGRMDEATGVVALTDERVVFIGRQLVIEERVMHAARSEFPFADLRKVDGEQRPLSGSLTLHLTRGRVYITDVNPPERATEIAGLAKARIGAERKGRKSSAARGLAPAGSEAIARAAAQFASAPRHPAEPALQKGDMPYETA